MVHKKYMFVRYSPINRFQISIFHMRSVNYTNKELNSIWATNLHLPTSRQFYVKLHNFRKLYRFRNLDKNGISHVFRDIANICFRRIAMASNFPYNFQILY